MKNRLKVGQPFTWDGKPARIVSGPDNRVSFSVFKDEGRRNRTGGYQFELAGFFLAVERGTAVVSTIPPHMAKQARILGEVLDHARAELMAKIEAGKVPDDWGGIEVRYWVTDYITAHYTPIRHPRTDSYKNALLSLL